MTSVKSIEQSTGFSKIINKLVDRQIHTINISIFKRDVFPHSGKHCANILR